MIMNCNTLLCVQNQMPEILPEDVFIVTYLLVGLLLLLYFVTTALKEK